MAYSTPTTQLYGKYYIYPKMKSKRTRDIVESKIYVCTIKIDLSICNNDSIARMCISHQKADQWCKEQENEFNT